jgi:hypothetical protein
VLSERSSPGQGEKAQITAFVSEHCTATAFVSEHCTAVYRTFELPMQISSSKTNRSVNTCSILNDPLSFLSD